MKTQSLASRLLLLSALLLVSTLSACKKASGPTATGLAADYKGPTAKGDWRVEWLQANPEGLNPIVGNDGYASVVQAYVFDTLLTFDVKSGEAVPGLATAWKISPDALSYEFDLHTDAKFHDGQPLTAEDVKFTYDAIMDPKTDSASLRNYLADIKEVKVLGPAKVKFTMKRPYFRNLIVLGSLQILPKHIYGKGAINTNSANRKPVGSGPYKFIKWDTGRLIEVERNPDWWGTKVDYYKDRYNFDKILFRVINEQNVAAMALKKGEIDAMEPTPSLYLKDFGDAEFEKNHYRIKYATEDGNGYRYIGWNLRKPLLQSKQVRQALAYLMPREEINSRMFNGLLTLAITHFPAGGSTSDPSLKPIAYNKEKASALLAEAGWKERDAQGYLVKDGKRFHFELLFSTGSSEGERFALIYQQALKEAGIDMAIRTIEWTVFLKQRQERKFDALMMSWGSSLDGDPYQIWHSSQEAGQGSNAGGFNVKRADELMDTARKTLDRAERNKMYQELSRILYDEQPYLFLFERPQLWVGTKRFAGVLPVGKLGLDASNWFTPPTMQKYTQAQ